MSKRLTFEDLPIGTGIYYHGDMANRPAHGEIVDHHSDEFGKDVVIQWDGDKPTSEIPLCMISDVDKGNGSTRFVTDKARAEYKIQKIAELIDVGPKEAIDALGFGQADWFMQQSLVDQFEVINDLPEESETERVAYYALLADRQATREELAYYNSDRE